ncbi:MAG: hypothetical protein Q8N36_04655, partial [bacterium]|nr:hypothetical protein [bacterium]
PPTRLIDFEASLNVYGNTGFRPFDTLHADGNIKPYRAWMRYSTNQFELRLGLQKINFGSANMLRPLMWFDQVDPRDPLQLTDGVWGLLARYYFLNNANLWLWGLWGNTGSKTWEIGKTNQKFPELGGRFQNPVPRGEVAMSYHYRLADTRDFSDSTLIFTGIPENRFGVDGKWDLGVGLWLEAAWINKSKNVGFSTNQEIINMGVDYTFGIGNGLNVTFESLLFALDSKPFAFSRKIVFSGLAANYPLGLFDNLSGIVYFDWTNNAAYNFVTWRKQFGKFDLFLMTYWNPDKYNLPNQENSKVLYTGKGVQLMVVYNY